MPPQVELLPLQVPCGAPAGAVVRSTGAASDRMSGIPL